MATANPREAEKHGCNWCSHADVELRGSKPDITCEVVIDVERDVLYLRPYTKKHAYPMEDAMRAEDSWEDWNEQANCPYFELATDPFEFTCPGCSGSGMGGSHVDSKLGCRRCGGSGNDVVLERRYWPWT